MGLLSRALGGLLDADPRLGARVVTVLAGVAGGLFWVDRPVGQALMTWLTTAFGGDLRVAADAALARLGTYAGQHAAHQRPPR